ncbi:cystatin-like fold lipoprotein [Bacillus cereus]|uniref:Cystatin-like fold lipoprotein n=1 Tax=Bacillus cereus TaxID=1396 RepID=A0A9X7M0Q8_BACCE|nr:cystatin-like fold lipoprotein [Bacillus cereus]MDA2637899.1 cystatin-like fold lipoprotein [Bacillus cereus]QDZ76610.1 cystatin-like fold lipoprotein [Bacillus cereus]
MRRSVGMILIGMMVLLSGCGNSYDKVIDQVIDLETVRIKDSKRDIEKVEREKTCVKVYEDGRVIEITYKIRKGDSIRSYYKNIRGNYKWVADTEAKQAVDLTEKPVYIEYNCE